jgi:hypothetical protein
MENENVTTEAPQVEQPQVEQPQVEAPQESQSEVQFFDNAEDFAQSMQQTQAQPEPEQQIQDTPYVDPEAAPAQQATHQDIPQYTNQQVEEAMFGYLSERLGKDIKSFDDLTYTEQQAPQQLDERIEKIAQFVSETGRSPEDYLSYQKMDPTNMDDMSVLLVNTSFQYPNLSNDEVRLLVKSKYKTDETIYSEQELAVSKLQMKVDAESARKGINDVRETYRAPAQQAQAEESFIDDEWLSNMKRETAALTGLEFDLGNGSSFQFGLDDSYRNQLIQKNSQLEDYFDPYVSDDGAWDYDKLNSHRAVVDNIDMIVSNAYRQGISDGQKNVVTKVANSSVQSPQTNPNQNPVDPVNEQLKGIVSNVGNGLSFNPRI